MVTLTIDGLISKPKSLVYHFSVFSVHASLSRELVSAWRQHWLAPKVRTNPSAGALVISQNEISLHIYSHGELSLFSKLVRLS